MRRRRPGRAGAPVRVGVAALGLVVVLAGCAGMPDSGPIVEAQVPSVADNQRASDIDPVPPTVDESPAEVVQGFLEAMTASPISTTVAKEYLTPSAAQTWNPESSTITYSDTSQPRQVGSDITVTLLQADRLGRTGAWEGRLPAAQQRLHFEVVPDADGQWRINNPPDALVVPQQWFAQRYRRASLYFFDRSAEILVPQPVFLPLGDQQATSLVDGLLAGPGDDLRRVLRSFLPPQLSLKLSVVVSPAGVADIELVGPDGRLSADAVRHLLAQLAWTLRQDPDITALTLSINGTAIPLPGGASTYSLDQAAAFDPNFAQASTRLYGLQGGLLASSFGSDFEPTSGPLGTKPHALRSVTVDLRGDQAAGVTSAGTAVLVAATGTPTTGGGTDTAPTGPPVDQSGVRRVAQGTDFLPPAWDFSGGGRLWLVDRRDDGARVSYLSDVAGGRPHVVTVPGVSGTDVKAFLVSRDGTRFVAAVAGALGDRLLVGRIEVGESGVVTGVTRATSIAGTASAPMRIKDIGWTSPTTVAVLVPLPPSGVFEVSTVSVDGSPSSAQDLATTVSGSVVGLAGSPTPDKPPYAVTRTGLADLAAGTFSAFVHPPVTAVDYVG